MVLFSKEFHLCNKANIYISEVYVPTGTRIRTGTVNPVFDGVGNAIQYELLQRLPTSAFRNTVGF